MIRKSSYILFYSILLFLFLLTNGTTPAQSTPPPMYQPPPMTIPTGTTIWPTPSGHVPIIPTKPLGTPGLIQYTPAARITSPDSYSPKKYTPSASSDRPSDTSSVAPIQIPSIKIPIIKLKIPTLITKSKIVNQTKMIGSKVYSFFKYVIENCLP